MKKNISIITGTLNRKENIQRLMNCNNRKEYTIATLHYWAKQDNPEMRESIMKDAMESLINTSINIALN